MLFSPMLFFFTFLFFSVLKTHWTVTPRPNSELYNNLPLMCYPKMPIFPLDILDCDLNKVVFPVFHFLMFKLKSCVWISEGFNEVKKTLVLCVTSGDNKWQTSLSLFETTLPRRPRVLNRSIWRRGWVDVDATRAAGAIQKKRRHRLCSHSYLRKSRAFRRCKRLSLWLLPYNRCFAMSGKIKSRSAANAESISGGVSCDERILRDCHQLYTDPDSGELAANRTLRATPQTSASNVIY